MDVFNRRNLVLIGGVAVLAGLYVTSRYNYLLFHSIGELFSIVVACGIYMVAWNSRRFLENNYVMFIGVAFLFIASIDMLHLMSYQGMTIFEHSGANIPTQLWIAARYMQGISLVAAPFFIGRRLRQKLVVAAYAGVSVLLIAAIFYWKIFPDCFIEGQGLTPFKKVSEYVISLMLTASIYTLYMKSSYFDRKVVRLLYAAILTTIGAELAFTFYISTHGFSNLVGHYLKIVSFFLIYKALIETGLREPYNLLFRDLKQSEEALRESEERMNRAQEIAHLGSWELDFTNGRLTWSDEVYRMFGLRPQEFGASYEAFLEAVHPDDRAAVDAAYSSSLREGKDTYEIVHRIVRKKSGEVRYVHEKCEHIRDQSGRIIRSVGMVHDITERKKAGEERARLASFPELNPNPILEVDDAGNVHYLNPAAKDLLGLEDPGRHPFLADLKSVNDALKRKEKTYVAREVQVDGSWYEQAFHEVPESNRMRIYALDITERKKAEEELRKYREHLEELVWERTKELQAVNSLLELASRESSRDEYLGEVAKLLQSWSGCRCVGIRVLDDKGNIPYGAYLGFSREFWESENSLIIGRDHCVCTRIIEGRPEPQETPVVTRFGSFRADNIGEFVAGLTGEEKARYRGVCIEYGFKSVAIIPVRYEDRIIAAVHIADEQEGKVPRATVEFVENRTPLIGEAINKLGLEQRLRENYAELVSTNDELEREIGERARAEAQLLQSQKMEAVGQLAGGIAHDFNNRLFAIRNYAHILKTRAGGGAETETLEKILVSCDKAAKLVDDLLKFSRKKEINPRPVDLNHILEEAESLLRVAVGKTIEFKIELSGKPLAVMADATQMEHVLINLVTNARDAMPDGGKLTIRTDMVKAEMVSGDMHSGGQRGPFAEIYISDTGPGMDEKMIEKIFEPFFTTKEIGKGTGLGLSIVYGVVRQHDGFIEVQSQPGNGATFKIHLPLI